MYMEENIAHHLNSSCTDKEHQVSWRLASIFLILALNVLASCRKLVEVSTPDTSLSAENVYQTDATAISTVTGIYSSLSNSGTYGSQLPGMTGLGGLSADELTLYSG